MAESNQPVNAAINREDENGKVEMNAKKLKKAAKKEAKLAKFEKKKEQQKNSNEVDMVHVCVH